MVQWKGDVSDDCGGRAIRLDSIESFQVPNFFVITSSEIKNFVEDIGSAEDIRQDDFPDELKSDIKDAYSDINVSSEVRNASGKARDLVEGNRNGGKVTVRISGEKRGVYDHRINVGASGLVEAVKDVLESFYRVNDEGVPAIIVQRMIEPDASGAAIKSYMGHYGLVETVKGLGTALEEGKTVPELYILDEGKVAQNRIPDEQLETTINPMNGDKRQKKVKRNEPLLQRSEVEKLYDRINQEGYNVKFVYKRGTFYIVDAFESESRSFDRTEVSLNSIRVSDGEINGIVGREVSYTDNTVSPDQYSKAAVSKKGGYTSKDAQLARNQNKPAIFSLNGKLEHGEQVRAEPHSTEIERASKDSKEHNETNDFSYSEKNDIEDVSATRDSEINATEVIPLNHGNGLYLSPPFTGNYAVTEGRAHGKVISPENYITNFGDFFRFKGDEAVVDGRKMEDVGLKQALSYPDPEIKILILKRPRTEVIRAAIEQDYVIATEYERLEDFKKIVSREERRFIMEKLRQLSD